VLSGQSPLGPSAFDLESPASGSVDRMPGIAEWRLARDRVIGPQTTSLGQRRRLAATYQEFVNCPDWAFANALRTFEARTERYGRMSAEVRGWMRAQDAVFRNCEEETL